MICSLEQLANCRGVLLHGCWRVLHPGHIRLIRWAAGQITLQSEPLIVTLTSDAFISKQGGSVLGQNARAEMLDAIRWVDSVAIVDEPTGLLAINTIKPRLYIKGAGDDTLREEAEAVGRNGGQLICMPKERDDRGIYSTTRILNV